MPNVICMKWGAKYGAEDVNVLHAMVRRNTSAPVRFVCFTDNSAGLDREIEVQDIPAFDVPAATAHKPWRKLTTLMPDFGGLEGKTLFLDLDVVVTGPLDPMFTYTNKFAIAENWSQPGKGVGNSSVYCYEIGKYAFVLDTYAREYDRLVETYPNSQTFMSRALGPEHIEWWPQDWVVSFKYTCMRNDLRDWALTPRLPEGARVVAFHGNPKPSDAIVGRYPGKPLKRVRPTPWVAQHWRV